MSQAWAVTREIRRRTGWTQRELAARAHTTPATIARIEKGRLEPTVELMERIARGAGFALRLALEPADPGEQAARTRARRLTDQQRLKQNDRLSRVWASSVNARG